VSTSEKWYAIRTRPGFQRTIPGGRLISQIEKVMEDEQYECFAPSFLYEVKHHRTKQWMLKRAPLLVGYAFINLHAGQSLDDLRGLDGVMCVLKPHRHLPPIQFKPADMERLREIEREADHSFRNHQYVRIEWERKQSHKISRKDLRNAFPPDTMARIVDDAPFGGMVARVLGPSSRGKVKAVIELLNSFTSIDVPIENLRQAS
jgi:transcription antitermination factor NusG